MQTQVKAETTPCGVAQSLFRRQVGEAHEAVHVDLFGACIRAHEIATDYANRREAFGKPESAAADLVAGLVKSLGLPGRLSEVGVGKDRFREIAEKSMHDGLTQPLTGGTTVAAGTFSSST